MLGRKTKDLTIKEFKNIQVLERIQNTNRPMWKCKCKCGKIFIRRHDYIVSNPNSSCGCMHPTKGKRENRKLGKESKTWRGYGDIKGMYYSQIKNRAKNANLEFDITIQELWNLFIKQDKRCALTNIPLNFKQSRRTDEEETTASLDRIDSSKGYTIDNIQWIHKDVNIMKNHFKQEYFINICKIIANRH